MTSGWSNEYLREIAKRREAGGETELTYRTPIENMLNAASQELAKDRQLTIQHEPERQSGSSPDFRITDDGETVIGYIECKKTRRLTRSRPKKRPTQTLRPTLPQHPTHRRLALVPSPRRQTH